MGNMQLKEIVSIQAASINPMDAPDKLFHLYSLPSFDENQKREEVYGRQIQSNKSIVPDKCILFNKLNVRFQRIWLIDNDDEDKICSTEFLPLIVDETKVDFYYCYFLLHSPGITNYLIGQNTNTSGSHKRIDPDDFLSIEVQLPTLPEQKRIGKFLYDIEKKITVNRHINDYLEAMARQLYDYWFVQFDFPDKNGEPYKSSGGKMVWDERLKRNLPEGWTIQPLGELLSKLSSGNRPTGGINKSLKTGIPSLGAECIDSLGVYDYTSTPYVPVEFKNLVQKGVIENNDILVYKDGAYVGKTTLFRDGFPFSFATVNEHVFLLHAKDECFQEYLLYTLLLPTYFELMQMSGKAKAAQPGLNQDDIKNLSIIVPSKRILQIFSKKISGLHKKLFNNSLTSARLLGLREELMPILLNGQVSVKQLNNHLSYD